MALLKRVEGLYDEREVPYTAAELARYEARVRRVRGEVAEIRAATAAMRTGGGAFHTAAADFLDAEALFLERSNNADGGVELDRNDDTREDPLYGITSARRALLLARAWNTDHPQDQGENLR